MCICPVLGLGPNCPACPACRVPSLTNAASSWPPAHVSPACRARPSAEPGGARAAHCQRSRNKGTSPTGAAVFAATTRVNLHSSMRRLLCAPGCSLVQVPPILPYARAIDMPSGPAQKALEKHTTSLLSFAGERMSTPPLIVWTATREQRLATTSPSRGRRDRSQPLFSVRVAFSGGALPPISVPFSGTTSAQQACPTRC